MTGGPGREISGNSGSRINAAARLNNVTYSRLIDGMKKTGIKIDRKVLADIAVNDSRGFSQIVVAATGEQRV